MIINETSGRYSLIAASKMTQTTAAKKRLSPITLAFYCANIALYIAIIAYAVKTLCQAF